MTGQNNPNAFNSSAHNPGVASRQFWESKAPGYPLPFEEKTFARTSAVIDILAEKGLLAKGMKVLDIGCGTGAFALPLAQRGATVAVLDISDSMLKRLAGEAQRLHIDLGRAIRSSWKEIDIREDDLEGAFDLALTAFSAAVETEEDFLKMERCSTEWCCFIASGKTHRSHLCDEIFRAVDAPRDPRPDIRFFKGVLERMGRDFLFDSFSQTISEEKSPRQISELMVNRLEAAGKAPDPDSVFATVSAMCAAHAKKKKRTVECHGRIDIGVLMWRVDGKPL